MQLKSLICFGAALFCGGIEASATERNSYFGLGINLPFTSSASLAGWHDDSSARIGPRVTLGQHMNKWFTLEGEGYYTKVKIHNTVKLDNTDPGDRSTARGMGVMINGLIRKDCEKMTLWMGVGAGFSRNKVSDYTSETIGVPLLTGTERSNLALQGKLGITYNYSERIGFALSTSYLNLGKFGYINPSGGSPTKVQFKTSITAINAAIQFKF